MTYALMCKSVFEFNKLYYEILNKFGKYLVDNTIQIRTELRQNKRGYYLPNSKPEKYVAPFFGKKPDLEILDKLDEDILSILSVNARIQILDIANLLDKPASTISSRIKSLEKKGIIQGYSTYIKSQNYGMQSYRLLLYLEGMDENSRNSLFEYASQNAFMILAIEVVGKWNFEITTRVKDHAHLQEEISKLRNKFSNIIKNIEFVIMIEDDLIYDPYPLKKNERKF